MAPKRTEDSSKPSVESEATEPVVGKGRPTPSRKAAQAANQNDEDGGDEE